MEVKCPKWNDQYDSVIWFNNTKEDKLKYVVNKIQLLQFS